MDHFYMAETCAKRQPVPLKTDNQIIQNQDYPVISLNARWLSASGSALFHIKKASASAKAPFIDQA